MCVCVFVRVSVSTGQYYDFKGCGMGMRPCIGMGIRPCIGMGMSTHCWVVDVYVVPGNGSMGVSWPPEQESCSWTRI